MIFPSFFLILFFTSTDLKSIFLSLASAPYPDLITFNYMILTRANPALVPHLFRGTIMSLVTRPPGFFHLSRFLFFRFALSPLLTLFSNNPDLVSFYAFLGLLF